MNAQSLALPIDIDELRVLLRKYGVRHASVFGSYARGEARKDSDLDLLVDYADGVSLFDHFNLKEELTTKTGVQVDVVSRRALSAPFRPFVEHDQVAIL